MVAKLPFIPTRSSISIGAFAAMAVLLVASVLVVAPASGQQPEAETLASLAPERLAVGGVLHSYDPAWDDGRYAEFAATEFDSITATAYMPWGPHDSPDRVDTAPLDRVVEWARSRDLRVHGHTLLYPAANETLDWYQNLETGHHEVLENYIDTIASSNAGDVWVWDVVNEVFADPGETADDRGLRTSYLEYDIFGGRYDEVFQWARAADPDAQLILNDYGAEALNSKSDAIFAEVTAMRDRGVPIDGVGFQMHVGDGTDWWGIRQNFQRFADAGFDIYITELDVAITRRTSPDVGPTQAERSRQRAIYEEATRIALEQPAVNALWLWDFADERSWLHPTRVPLGTSIPVGTYTFPAPFSEPSIGEPIVPKVGYFGMLDALRDHRDAPIFQRGLRRLQGVGGPDARYVGRAGTGVDSAVPDDGTWLGELTEAREDWLSLQWEVEPAGNGWFRLRSAWDEGAGDGYLTRVGVPVDGGFAPTDRVELTSLNEDWPSQLWRIERVAEFRYRLVNLWEPETGVLTRRGAQIALSEVAQPWGDQRWRIRQLD